MTDIHDGTTKQCRRCGGRKSTTRFYRDKSCSDGLEGQCKDCKRAYQEENREHRALQRALRRRENPAKESRRKKLWYRANKERMSVYWREYRARRQKDPLWCQQRAARQAVHAALSSGRLEKSPCEKCGALQVEAHHHRGYEPENSLRVLWLCPSCHGKEHRKIDTGAAPPRYHKDVDPGQQTEVGPR